MARIAMACIALLGLLVVACGTSKVEVDDTAGVEEIAEVGVRDTADASGAVEMVGSVDGTGDTIASDVCRPSCKGSECGDDGCGGSCGECDECMVCLAGSCVEPATGTLCQAASCAPQCQDSDDWVGCACESDNSCEYGFCVPALDGRICGPLCLEECPEGWSCGQFQMEEYPDSLFACLPVFLSICRPCREDVECFPKEWAEPFNLECVEFGPQGSFCTGACQCTAECPVGYVCDPSVVPPGGEAAGYCLPADFDGECPCNAYAKQLGAGTVCYRENEHGVCHGERTCGEEGLSACDAPEPAPEECDGKDNNCDGQVDEGCASNQECEGKECGPDGSGGSCGECQEGFLCAAAGLCFCNCTPECEGKECGPDMCMSTCGSCGDGEVCSEGSCCTPDCEGKACGPDGCGGECGACDEYDECVEGLCMLCAPQCAGKECGDDGCGGSCGTCAEGTWCQQAQICAACKPNCEGKECGPDGCDGICGACGCNESCQDGLCKDLCLPDCANKMCGPDGCGCSCGECPDYFVCQDGWCNPAPDGPCLRAEDCFLHILEPQWPEGWEPECLPGSCTCHATSP